MSGSLIHPPSNWEFEDIESFDPLYLSAGNLLTPQSKTGNRYSFERMRFSEMKILPYPGNGTDVDSWMPENLNQVLCFQPVSNCVKIDGLKDVDGQAIKLDWNSLKGQPCCFISSSGSLIPQMICPWNVGANSVALESEISEAQIEEEVLKKNVLWRLKDSQKDLPLNQGVTEFTNHISYHASSIDVYPGLSAKGIVMIGMKDEYDNLSAGTFHRKFEAKVPKSGAYAMLIQFDVDDTTTSFENSTGTATVTFSSTEEEKTNSLSKDTTDTIQTVFSASAETHIQINSKYSASGILSFSNYGTKVPFSFSVGEETAPVVFFYSLLNKMVLTGEFSSNPEIPTKAIKCSKDPDLNISEIADPSFAEFPKKHKKNGTNYIRLKKDSAYPKFGQKVTMEWNNAYGTFAIIPIRYCPVVKFSFFFRISGQTDFSRGSGGGTQYDYFVLEYGVRYEEKGDETFEDNGEWTKLRTVVDPVKISYSEEKQSTLYRADFVIKAKETTKLQYFPFEIFSLIHVSKRTGKLTDVLNKDGDFSSGFKSNVVVSKYQDYTKNSNLPFPTGKDGWMKFITQASISHTLDGTTGSLTLDKQAMMELGDRPDQVIGALTLVANNGFYNQDGTTINGVQYIRETAAEYSTLPWGQIFKGYAMKIQDSLTDGNSSLTIELAGIQKKLEDMVLVNCPFWDGDDVFGDGGDKVLNYMIDYSGCDLKWVPAFSGYKSSSSIFLPRSADWKSPAVNFVMGTTVKEALIQIGKYINHRFVIQPDGRGYFYYLDKYGKPDWLQNAPVRMKYSSSDILSMNISPHLENRYNSFLTLGLLGEGNSETGQMEIKGTSPGYKFTQKKVESDDWPWSRIITNKENGIVTLSELEDRHYTNVNFASATIYDGNITVPGFHEFYLFDKISIDDVEYYIIGISHSINLQNKEWTTSLNIGKYITGSYKESKSSGGEVRT